MIVVEPERCAFAAQGFDDEERDAREHDDEAADDAELEGGLDRRGHFFDARGDAEDLIVRERAGDGDGDLAVGWWLEDADCATVSVEAGHEALLDVPVLIPGLDRLSSLAVGDDNDQIGGRLGLGAVGGDVCACEFAPDDGLVALRFVEIDVD